MATSTVAVLDSAVALSLSNRVRVLGLVFNKQNPFRFSFSVSASHLPCRDFRVSLSFLEIFRRHQGLKWRSGVLLPKVVL